MRAALYIALAVILLTPGLLIGEVVQQPGVNPRGIVDSVEITGIDEDEISQDLRDAIRNLAGQPFDQSLADDLVKRIQAENPEFMPTVRLLPSSQSDRVNVLFLVEKATGQPAGGNVNSRYTVERVDLQGFDESRLSQPIRDELSKLVGERLDPNKAEQIQDQIADELGPRFYVARRVARGSNRQFIVVIYDVRRVRLIPFAAQPPQHILYHSKQNFSAIAHLPIPLGEGNRFTFGLADDQDLLLERFAGFNTAFEMTNVGTNHVGLALRYSRYHERWQPATVDASPTSVYRERNNFEPSLTFAFDPRFRLTAGVNLSDLQMQYPAIHRANSNSAVGSLIFENVWRRGSEEAHSVRASYEFRTGTHELDSDFIYTRHLVSGQYQYAQDNKRLLLGLMAGTIAGNAPLFERFSLGNTSTLRGWNKFDIAPLGGNRVLHAVVQYGLGGPDIVTFNRARRSRIDFDLHVFYDVGVVGDRGTPMTAKHSVGFGFGSPGSSGFFLDLGFPIRSNRIQPIFMMGFRF